MKSLREIVPLNEKRRRVYTYKDLEGKGFWKNQASQAAGGIVGGLAGTAVGGPAMAVPGAVVGMAVGNKFTRHAMQDRLGDLKDKIKARLKGKK